MSHQHNYKLKTVWKGNSGTGTSNIKKYDRSHTVTVEGKPELNLTTDNPFVGDKSKLNPEDLLVAAIASCHMLSYLYVCAMEGVNITSYEDNATGIMIEKASGGGAFQEVTLNPTFTVSESSMIEKAISLHHQAHEICYIANSVNFEVKCNPVCVATKI
jgi:organic hydroperoxide reductase OsmC/OhrA